MRTVLLYGEMGKRWGRRHQFDVRSPGEAIRALIANFPDIERYMFSADKVGVGFRVLSGKEELESEKDSFNPTTGDIKIIPTVFGSSAGVRILVGAALIVGGTLTGNAFLVQTGVALAIGGAIQMLSPPPPSSEPPERPENTPSYLFNGPVNTTAAGHPVPVGYGRLIVGGAVISGGVSIDQIKTGLRRVATERFILISFRTGGPTVPVPSNPINTTEQTNFNQKGPFKRYVYVSQGWDGQPFYRYNCFYDEWNWV